jgi:hypothetical protein
MRTQGADRRTEKPTLNGGKTADKIKLQLE